MTKQNNCCDLEVGKKYKVTSHYCVNRKTIPKRNPIRASGERIGICTKIDCENNKIYFENQSFYANCLLGEIVKCNDDCNVEYVEYEEIEDTLNATKK